MKRLLEALQFLTILQFKPQSDRRHLADSLVYFPLIGAFLGLILIVIHYCLKAIFPQNPLSLILVIALIILTRALHLDGLADTCDALFSSKDKAEMLSIMRDSHKGTFGVIAIVTLILLKVNLLALIPADLKNLNLFLMTVLSRYGMHLAIFFFPYARQEGKAGIFFENKNFKIFILSTLTTLLLLGVTLSWRSLAVFILVVIFTLTLCFMIKRKIGGLTGDTLGAVCELSELVVLLCGWVMAVR